MCGRYYVAMEEETVRTRAILQEILNRDLPMAREIKGGEVYPGQIAPVILMEQGYGYTVRPMKWGFPRYGGGGLVINSRSEKADATPMFSKAVRERRCLVPANRFFEWRHSAGGSKTKDKFSFSIAGEDDLMYLAGVYGLFGGGFAEGGYDGFAILTQPADGQMSPYHDRMPVILREESQKKLWLTAPPSTPYSILRESFEPVPFLIEPAAAS